MPRLLMLLRHAKSDWNAGAASDFDRPLNLRGQAAAAAMASYIADLPQPPQLIISSLAQRARATAEAVAEELDEVGLELRDSFYGASSATLLQAVQELPDDLERVLLVGHNPTMSDLATELSGQAVEMKTASLAVLECTAGWERLNADNCRLLHLQHPRALTESA